MPKSIRTSQPQGVVRIDWDNPITRGLVLLADGGRQLYPYASFGGSLVQRVASAKGIGGAKVAGFGSTLGVGTTDNLATTLTTHNTLRTYVAWAYKNSGGGGGLGRVFDKRTAAVSTGSELLYWVDPDGTFQWQRDAATANGRWGFSASVGWGQTWAHVAVTHDTATTGTAPLLYWNGASSAVTTYESPSGAWKTDAAEYIIGNRNNDSLRNWDGLIGPVMLFDRILSAREIAALYANPWQLFEPEQRKVFLPPAVTSTTKKWHPTPLVRTTQPQGYAEIDDGNPLTRDLKSAVLPSVHGAGFFNVTRKTYENQNYWALKGNRRGRTLTFSGAGAQAYLSDNVASSASASGTVLGVVSRFDTSSVDNVCFASMTSSVIAHAIRYDGATKGWHCRASPLAGNREVTSSADPDANLEGGVFASRYNPVTGELDLWINGRKVNSSTFGASNWQAGISGWYASGSENRGMHVAYSWARWLSDEEIGRLTDNPWQLFKPDPRTAFFDHVTGSPYPVLSLAQLVNLLSTQATPRVTITVP